MLETQEQSLGGKHCLEKEMATHFSTFAGESHGQRCLVEYSPWDLKELDMTEQLANRLLVVHSVMSDSL